MSNQTASSFDINSNTLKSIPSAQLGGKKKSNGHKLTCGCPICKNMKKGASNSNHSHDDSSSDEENEKKTSISKKKSNGHKLSCGCPICKNMKHSKLNHSKHADKDLSSDKMGGLKKKNGHKLNCGCPICQNMKHAKKGGNDGIINDEETGNTIDTEQADDSNSIRKYSKTTTAEDDDYDEIDNIPENNPKSGGGTRCKNRRGGRKTKRRGNGHKKNCKCPICKNMKKKLSRKNK